jgi:(1->4)-alpha-D-glucan 1-alpha-D-glucosylmutase
MREFIATYRVQLGPQFGFADVKQLVPYLTNLGVSHLYLSPIWKARAQSTHGYDVVDPTSISEELGGEEQFLDLARADIGIILDVVPNHMAIDDANPYWSDEVLREKFFDIDPVSGFHRRFFDVDDLAGVRVEDPEVFAVTHQKLKELISLGIIDGIRIDHIDGLAEPAKYLKRLRQLGATHVWVEKILEPGEELRDWPVQGTTGYDFLNDVTALFIEPDSEPSLTELSQEIRNFSEFALEAKLEQVASTFVPEVDRLRTLFDVPEVGLALASLPVYRTYVGPDRKTDDADRSALSHLPNLIRTSFQTGATVPAEFITRFQQTTGAVMAKGVEDTALYRYVRLLALNEVGGDPERFGLSVDEYHRANARRSLSFPRSLLASQTHDTKRSGDVRARLVALSHFSDDWVRVVQDWHEMSSRWRSHGAPDWNEELFIYQTLVSGWPIGMDRLGPYLQKAFREAKRNTNWIEPDKKWEEQTVAFCVNLIHDKEFLCSFEPFAERVAFAGEAISLSQLVLRLTGAGTPDIYQGDETWSFSFVDPDNRRAVDWKSSNGALHGLQSDSLVIQRTNAKLFVTNTILSLRHRHHEAFRQMYEPLPASSTTCAYRRGDDIIVAVPVRNDSINFELPDGEWENILAPLEEFYPSPAAVYERLRS